MSSKSGFWIRIDFQLFIPQTKDQSEWQQPTVFVPLIGAHIGVLSKQYVIFTLTEASSFIVVCDSPVKKKFQDVPKSLQPPFAPSGST